LVVTDISARKFAERAQDEMSRRILNAQEAERQRVARDLHDGVIQLLSTAKYRLNETVRGDSLAGEKRLAQVRRLLEKAIQEVRLIGRNLRPSELDDLGLSAALRSLAQEFHSRYGIAAQCRCTVDGRMPAEIEMAFYRIAQEALTNVAKHARATRVELAVVSSHRHAALSIRDNGKGVRSGAANRTPEGWGLKNMKERAALLGGNLSLVTAPAKGTTVSVTIPFLEHHGSPARVRL
jgi:two-component system NarL family sensor kinase